ncbi:MAG: carbamoyl-phosphate synthase small subunit [Spirochaetes bacterium]|nr:MAG: carbamoyl-phosphate synthase small subunit [Spirochaetota bacterium]
MARDAFLILEDGTEFKGRLFGSDRESMGEVVFNTSMSGYQEVLTDPSYHGQIVAMTYPMIGNYGVNAEDVESARVYVAGFVVKEYSKRYSNFRATMSLEDYLVRENVAGIEGVDTRRLTRHIRDKGALRGGIFFQGEGAVARLKEYPTMEGLDLATGVSCTKAYGFGENDPANPTIAVYDFGVKTNILRLLKASGFNIMVYPANTPLADVIRAGAKGIFLSNGPGDPAAVPYARDLVKDIVRAKLPCFGICLGHQIMGLGLGGRTYKLKFGHRGANQPVKNVASGQVEITSQNHGFAVDYDSMKSMPEIEVTHMNLNDNTVEGFRHKTLPFFCVQYHPESSPGPHDSRYLFEEFRRLVTAV